MRVTHISIFAMIVGTREALDRRFRLAEPVFCFDPLGKRALHSAKPACHSAMAACCFSCSSFRAMRPQPPTMAQSTNTAKIRIKQPPRRLHHSVTARRGQDSLQGKGLSAGRKAIAPSVARRAGPAFATRAGAYWSRNCGPGRGASENRPSRASPPPS